METEPPVERAPSSCPSTTEPEPLDDAPMETEPRLYHFKIPYDPYMAWTQFVEKIFLPEPHKCLVMAENLNRATGHVHLQGYTRKSDRAIKDVRDDMHHAHGLYKEFERKRKAEPELMHRKRLKLSTTVKRATTTEGFQYMCKEVNVPLYQHGFTPEELTELHEKSNAYVVGKKQKVQDVYSELCKGERFAGELKKATDDARIESFMGKVRFCICEKYRKDNLKLPMSRYFGDDIINAIYSDVNCPAEMRMYLAKKLAKH